MLFLILPRLCVLLSTQVQVFLICCGVPGDYPETDDSASYAWHMCGAYFGTFPGPSGLTCNCTEFFFLVCSCWCCCNCSTSISSALSGWYKCVKLFSNSGVSGCRKICPCLRSYAVTNGAMTVMALQLKVLRRGADMLDPQSFSSMMCWMGCLGFARHPVVGF